MNHTHTQTRKTMKPVTTNYETIVTPIFYTLV